MRFRPGYSQGSVIDSNAITDIQFLEEIVAVKRPLGSQQAYRVETRRLLLSSIPAHAGYTRRGSYIWPSSEMASRHVCLILLARY
jgi:hypothetical protein